MNTLQIVRRPEAAIESYESTNAADSTVAVMSRKARTFERAFIGLAAFNMFALASASVFYLLTRHH